MGIELDGTPGPVRQAGLLVAVALGVCAAPAVWPQPELPAAAASAPAAPAQAASPPAEPAPSPPPPPRRLISDTGALYGDLSLPLTLSPALLRVLLTNVTLELPRPTGGRQRWQQRKDGTVEANSVTRQGLPWTETGRWRIDDEGRLCFSLDWLDRDAENWCHHVVKSDEGYFLVGGLKPEDPVRRLYVDGR
jgi:hypothetical protein